MKLRETTELQERELQPREQILTQTTVEVACESAAQREQKMSMSQVRAQQPREQI
jgi:hypothetical protein